MIDKRKSTGITPKHFLEFLSGILSDIVPQFFPVFKEFIQGFCQGKLIDILKTFLKNLKVLLKEIPNLANLLEYLMFLLMRKPARIFWDPKISEDSLDKLME